MYLATLKKGKPTTSGIRYNAALVTIESNLFNGQSDSWCVDYESTAHVCNTLQRFRQTRVPADAERRLRVGSSVTLAMKSIGCFTLSLPSSRKLILEDCFYVPRDKEI